MPKYPPLKVIRHVRSTVAKATSFGTIARSRSGRQLRTVSVASLPEHCRIWSGVTHRSGISFVKRRGLSTLSG